MRDLLIEAHKKSALRESSSTAILKASFDSNGGDLIKSITAAMMTLGGLHAPIKHVYSMLHKIQTTGIIPEYIHFPGFGSSFVKGELDPILYDLDDELRSSHKEVHAWMQKITIRLQRRNKIIYPNIAFFTAASALIEGEGIIFCESVVLEARVPVWIQILKDHDAQKES
jgi:citrate synthase